MRSVERRAPAEGFPAGRCFAWARRATPSCRPKHPSGAFAHPTKNFSLLVSLSRSLLTRYLALSLLATSLSPYSLPRSLLTRYSPFAFLFATPNEGWAERRQTPRVQ